MPILSQFPLRFTLLLIPTKSIKKDTCNKLVLYSLLFPLSFTQAVLCPSKIFNILLLWRLEWWNQQCIEPNIFLYLLSFLSVFQIQIHHSWICLSILLGIWYQSLYWGRFLRLPSLPQQSFGLFKKKKNFHHIIIIIFIGFQEAYKLSQRLLSPSPTFFFLFHFSESCRLVLM